MQRTSPAAARPGRSARAPANRRAHRRARAPFPWLPLPWLPLAAALAACAEQKAAEPPPGVPVDTTVVATQDVPNLVRAVGTVEAENQTVIKSELDGQVARIVADEGARVKRGDVILQIDPTPFRLENQQNAAALQRAEATLANDEQLLERYEKLLAAGALDQQTYDDVAARVKSERADVAQARALLGQSSWNVGKTTIRAPFSGQVADRFVELGSYVSSGDDLFELVNPTPVRVAFDIPETSAGVLEEGDPVRFTVRTQPDEVYEGEVVYVSPDLDPESRTQTMKAEYPNENGEIAPGAFADVEVTAAVRRDAPVIPEEALVSEGEQSFVYVVEQGKAEKREIELGQRLEGRIEVAKGLQGGEAIVVAGQRELSDGAPVRFAERPATAPGEVGPERGQAR